jgi:hypothetical protein
MRPRCSILELWAISLSSEKLLLSYPIPPSARRGSSRGSRRSRAPGCGMTSSLVADGDQHELDAVGVGDFAWRGEVPAGCLPGLRRPSVGAGQSCADRSAPAGSSRCRRSVPWRSRRWRSGGRSCARPYGAADPCDGQFAGHRCEDLGVLDPGPRGQACLQARRGCSAVRAGSASRSSPASRD